jgi:hypothetical protein
MRYLLLRLKRFCGFITGFIFLISGILKLMDPVGAGLIVKEYFDFLHISFMDIAAKPTGVFFALSEAILGAGLITGVWRRVITPVILGLQIFFTVITAILLIFNPEMDCGCFGEAVHLSHGETFIKNIILLTLLLIYYIPAKHLGDTKKKKYVSFGIVTVSVILFAAYSWAYLPLVEFTAFRPGAALEVSSSVIDYEAAFTYEKDGIQETFTLEDLPDSTWIFVSAQTVAKNDTEENSSSLSFYDKDGNYADSLAIKGNVIIVSVYDTNINDRKWAKIRGFIKSAVNAGFKPILLTSTYVEDIDIPDAYISDYKTLITLNRSNGGATYFCKGYLINKWPMRGYPDQEELDKTLSEDITEGIIGKETQESLTFQAFLLYIFAILLLL